MTCQKASQNSKRSVILVVEDEALSRMDVVATIEEAGFVALQAGNADEAIAILENRSDISVVVTDIVMPGSMDGLRLAHAVHGRWPPIRIIATPGDFTLDERLLPEGGALISKPYSAGEMINALHAANAAA